MEQVLIMNIFPRYYTKNTNKKRGLFVVDDVWINIRELGCLVFKIEFFITDFEKKVSD